MTFAHALSASLLLVAFAQPDARATTIYVDDTLSAACTTYDPATRSCSGGNALATPTIAAAANAAQAGDSVIVRVGTYREQLAPAHSGAPGAPIVFMSYHGEQATITGDTLSPAIWIFEHDYLIIEGFRVAGVQRWLSALGSNHLKILNNAFSMASDPFGSSKTGLFFQRSNFNIVRGNTLDSTTQDNLSLVESNNNLVESNAFLRAAHALWTIKCGNQNVFRRNIFSNADQKIGEIYDCDAVGYGDFGYDKITSLDATKHNVIELNAFIQTATPIDASPYAGIQHAGQHCVIRHNAFFHCIGPPIDLTLYADEAKFNYGNRIYNNIFFDNQFGGISVAGDIEPTYADNACINNIFFRNRFTQFDHRWQWYDELNGKPVQIITGTNDAIRFTRNDIFNAAPDDLYIVAYGDRTSASNPQPEPVSWWEQHYPGMFARNLQVDPQFIDTAALKLALRAGSPLIDAGAFLTTCASAGSGTSLPIADASYFRSGFGIDSLAGDTIQLEGGTATAIVLDIDYATNTLTLDAPLTWSAGQGVATHYFGSAPDLGIYEWTPASGVQEESPLSNEVIIYPNPAADRVTISLAGSHAPASISVTDVCGREIAACRVAAWPCTIDVSRFPRGVYVARIASQAESIARIFVRE